MYEIVRNITEVNELIQKAKSLILSDDELEKVKGKAILDTIKYLTDELENKPKL